MSKPSTLHEVYALFECLTFPECGECVKCCSSPWLLKEEYESYKPAFGNSIKTFDSIHYVVDSGVCPLAGSDGCHMYKDRPLDCRLFPLDIIEEDGIYWWCVYTTCPNHTQIEEKLIPIIPRLEELLSEGMLQQFAEQISVTKLLYPPYHLGQYEKVRPLTRKT